MRGVSHPGHVSVIRIAVTKQAQLCPGGSHVVLRFHAMCVHVPRLAFSLYFCTFLCFSSIHPPAMAPSTFKSIANLVCAADTITVQGDTEDNGGGSWVRARRSVQSVRH
jgi:hypothetical protein